MIEGRIVRHRIQQRVATEMRAEVQVGSRPVISIGVVTLGIAETDVISAR